AAQYAGDWRVTAHGADVPIGADAGLGNARLVLPFYGTRLDLTVRRGDDWGVLYVTVDGQPANRLPRDEAGRAYLSLYDPLHATATVTLASGLPDGPHEAAIVADGGWGGWAIAGWTVGREPDLRPYRLALLLLGLVSIPCLAVTGLYLYRARPALLSLWRDLAAAHGAWPEGGRLLLLALVAAAFYFAPVLPLSLIALLLLALLVFLRPDHGLALVAFGIPFFLRPKPLAGKAFSLVEIVTLLCFAAWAARAIRGALSAVHRPGAAVSAAVGRLRSTDMAVAFLVGLGALSLAWADNFGVASREFRVVVVESGLFYLLLRAEAGQRGERLYLLVVDALVAGAVVVSGLGLWQFLVSGDVIAAEGVRRVRALYGSPNNLALFLERIVPLLVALAFWGRNRWRRWLYALALLPACAATFLTFSKGALFLGLPASLLFLGLVRGRRALALAVVALAVLALALLPFLRTERLASTFDLQAGTAFFRLKLWQSSLNLLRQHPLTGVGLDNFLYAYRTRYVLPAASHELNQSHPHNVVLDFWTRLGLGGVVALFWLLVAFFAAGLRRYRRLPDGDDRALVLGLLASVVAALAHGLIDQTFFLVDLAFVFMLALAGVQRPGGGQPQGLPLPCGPPAFADDAEKAGYVSGLFARIAPRYDLMNRLMTGGRDRAWRRTVARLAALPPGGRVLDVATGTGDIALALAERYPGAQVVGADFSLEMMAAGRRKFAARGRIGLAAGDALRLPFPDGSFDAVATGFALRNVTDVSRAFAEMYRLVKPGGRVVCLEISRPTLPLFRSLFAVYFYRVVPWLGGLVSGQKDAYAYLPNSLTGFLTPEEVRRVMQAVGWRQVRYRRLMMGTVAIHVGVKEA
ncbi:MAG: ubiquinone/menaquinone biosynthesis methyltransferase, partial [Anaerolineae bacterium]